MTGLPATQLLEAPLLKLTQPVNDAAERLRIVLTGNWVCVPVALAIGTHAVGFPVFQFGPCTVAVWASGHGEYSFVDIVQ